MCGCIFIRPGEGLANSICEACYRTHHHGQESYLKCYKHCILASAITPEASRNICRCKNLPHVDSLGHYHPLFPVDSKAKHLNIKGKGGKRCGLLQLPESVALAKYDGMQTILGKARGRDSTKQNRKDKENDIKIMQEKNANKGTRQNRFHLKKVIGANLVDTKEREAARGETIEFEEAKADKDIPFFIRKYTERYPFGNMHMSLRVGPLLVENGVAQ